jgi:hypothetical protein
MPAALQHCGIFMPAGGGKAGLERFRLAFRPACTDRGRMQPLAEVPVVDVRSGGPLAHAAMRLDAIEDLRLACLSSLRRLAHPMIPLADAVSRRWLERTASPYIAEVAAIADLAKAPGVFLVNSSYEWACTAASCRRSELPLLVRTLDWPFAGLGRHVTVARQVGSAGEFWNVTWPGAVGVLTAVAPGRFAATINQAPLRRRTRAHFLRWLDHSFNAVHTYGRVRHAPPAHVLRQVFETAADYASAQRMLMGTPVARPALVANDWQQSRPGWEPRFCGLPVEVDSLRRRDTLAAQVVALAEPFGWLRPPVHNWATRVAVETSAAAATLRVVGFEPVGTDVPSVAATHMLDLSPARMAA